MTTEFVTQTPSATAARTSRTRTVVLGCAALVAGAGIAAGVIAGFGSASAAPVPVAPSSASATPAPVAPSSASATADGSGAHHAVTPSGAPSHHVTPAVPSAPIETLQRELGQLNYYQGPITGTMTGPTTQAIRYLQRDAHLPQTGTMNTATTAALAHFLATGNNQMGS